MVDSVGLRIQDEWQGCAPRSRPVRDSLSCCAPGLRTPWRAAPGHRLAHTLDSAVSPVSGDRRLGPGGPPSLCNVLHDAHPVPGRGQHCPLTLPFPIPVKPLFGAPAPITSLGPVGPQPGPSEDLQPLASRGLSSSRPWRRYLTDTLRTVPLLDSLLVAELGGGAASARRPATLVL